MRVRFGCQQSRSLARHLSKLALSILLVRWNTGILGSPIELAKETLVDDGSGVCANSRTEHGSSGACANSRPEAIYEQVLHEAPSRSTSTEDLGGHDNEPAKAMLKISPDSDSTTPPTMPYSVGHLGENACPSGYMPITMESGCQSAATALGLAWKGTGEFSFMPSGCFEAHIGVNGAHFNTHASGEVQTITRLICTKAATSRTVAVGVASVEENIETKVEQAKIATDINRATNAQVDEGTMADGTAEEPSHFQTCVSSWCLQSGTSEQYTKCESVSGTSCRNPTIKYGSVEEGIPHEHKNNDPNTWCSQLGFSPNGASVTYASRPCKKGRLFWCNSFDETAWHWCDALDGYWKDQELNATCIGNGIASLVCHPRKLPKGRGEEATNTNNTMHTTSATSTSNVSKLSISTNEVSTIRLHTCNAVRAGTDSAISMSLDSGGTWHNMNNVENHRKQNQWDEYVLPGMANKIMLKIHGSNGWCLDRIILNGVEVATGLPQWLDNPCTGGDGVVPCSASGSWIAEACDWQCYLDRYANLRSVYGKNNTAGAQIHYNHMGRGQGHDCTCPVRCTTSDDCLSADLFGHVCTHGLCKTYALIRTGATCWSAAGHRITIGTVSSIDECADKTVGNSQCADSFEVDAANNWCGCGKIDTPNSDCSESAMSHATSNVYKAIHQAPTEAATKAYKIDCVDRYADLRRAWQTNGQSGSHDCICQEPVYNYTFKPGKIGLGFETYTGYVSEVFTGGQAEALGVKKGMRLAKIGSTNYSVDHLQATVAADVEYQLTFVNPAPLSTCAYDAYTDHSCTNKTHCGCGGSCESAYCKQACSTFKSSSACPSRECAWTGLACDTAQSSNATSRDETAVVLVVLSMRADRTEPLMAYQQWFPFIVFLEPIQITLGRSRIETISECNSSLYLKCFTFHGFYHASCLSDLLREVLPKTRPFAQGMLALHMDFWIQPSRFQGEFLDRIWQLNEGLTPQRFSTGIEPWNAHETNETVGPICYEKITACTVWHWHSNSQRNGLKAAQMALNDYAPNSTKAVRVCAAWSDLFYLPRAVWKDFSDLATVYFNGTFHEVAIPTIIDFLVRFKGARRNMLSCWGSCCASAATTLEMSQHKCGHRMDLAKASTREALTKIIARSARPISNSERLNS